VLKIEESESVEIVAFEGKGWDGGEGWQSRYTLDDEKAVLVQTSRGVRGYFTMDSSSLSSTSSVD
jgi:hypothetical protein